MIQLLYFILTQLPILGLVYQKAFEKLPQQLQTDFADYSLMLVYPDQQEENNEIYDFIDPHHHDTPTSSTRIGKWLSKWIGEMG